MLHVHRVWYFMVVNFTGNFNTHIHTHCCMQPTCLCDTVGVSVWWELGHREMCIGLVATLKPLCTLFISCWEDAFHKHMVPLTFCNTMFDCVFLLFGWAEGPVWNIPKTRCILKEIQVIVCLFSVYFKSVCYLQYIREAVLILFSLQFHAVNEHLAQQCAAVSNPPCDGIQQRGLSWALTRRDEYGYIWHTILKYVVAYLRTYRRISSMLVLTSSFVL